VLFEKRLREGLADGSVTLAVRRWRRPQVSVGGVYRTGAGGPRVAVRAFDVVRPQDLTADDAHAAGYPDAAALLGSVRGQDLLPLYRIRFEVVPGDDPRERLALDGDLSGEDLAALLGRLARVDAAAADGPWTEAVLDLVARRPAVVSTVLAAELGVDRPLFKRRVASLKAMGLTTSLEVGYRLSPRGAAVHARLRDPQVRTRLRTRPRRGP
jgi:hypothetical protein